MTDASQQADATGCDVRPAGLREIRFEYSRDFPRVLEYLDAALLISTYQAGKLVVIGTHAGQLTFAFHDFDRVMGVAASFGRLAVGTRRQVFFLRAAHEFAPRIEPAGTYDGCWLARSSFVTGSIHGHDLAWGENGLWVVNTLFSCLCTLNDDYNFVPRWRPSFISTLIDQDRCHLNGLAMESGQPRFVTVLAESDEPAGWRPTKTTSGVVIDVHSGEVVVRGLCMPHSPRLHEGRFWVLDSGRGHLDLVDVQRGQAEAVAALPGYTRGLACRGPYAFVGLSKIRETAIFGGLPVGEHLEELRCGVGVIELSTGRTIATLQFHSGVEEIFAVELLPGTRNPKLCGPSLAEDSEHDIWIVPSTSGDTLHHRLTTPPDVSTRDAQHPAAPVGDSPSPSPTIHASIPAVPRRGADTESAQLVRQSVAAHEQGQLVEALTCLRRAAECTPGSSEVLNHLGNLYQDLNDQAAALACYRQAVAVEPDYAPAHQNLGVLWAALNEPHRALQHFERAQQSQPQAMNLLLGATVLPVIYDSLEDVATWRRRLADRVRTLVEAGVAIDTTSTMIPTNFYFAYQGENDRAVMEDLGRVYRGVQCCPAAHEAGSRPRGRRIRVGFLSAHFRDHTIGRLNLGRVQHLSRTDFEVTVVSAGRQGDETTQAFAEAADQFLTVPRDVAVARQQIAALELDILVFADVGMDALTYTLAHSRMAPLQCVTWGHPDTTGSQAIDYFISSELLETVEADAHYTERLIRLPNLGTYYCCPQLSDPPRTRDYFSLAADRHVYLCPQTLFKFHPAFDVALSGILQADPQGELVIIDGRVPNWTARLKRRFASALGEAASRVRFVSPQPNADFLHLLAAADVVLDPFPFGGGNTTYEALAVGAPVVSWPGRFLRGRIADALHQRMGIRSGMVASADEYVETAVRLANDREYSGSIRTAIAAARHVLFENLDDVRALEVALHEIHCN